MVWQWLEDSYGSPEVIEHSLLKRIEDFPKLSNRDNQLLQLLGDLLLEVEFEKSGLAVLDMPRAVNPIVEKLPYGLQEKWVSQGLRYKEEYRVPFPPFSFFSQFIRSQAKTKNDPSFIFTSNTQSHFKSPKPTKSPVSVRKTEVLLLQVHQRKSRMIQRSSARCITSRTL